MGYLPIAGVQKIFHLDVAYPQFPTREEILEFFVDGVKVTAIANHAWRRISVKIIEPFQITAWTYFPPFFGLGFFMLQREAELVEKGIASREDFILRARSAYLRHVAYLRLKPQVDAAQEEFMSVFSDDLQSLGATDLAVKDRVSSQKRELRRNLKADQITQRQIQIAFKQLDKEAWDASSPYSDLKRQVDDALEEIKESIVDQVFPTELKI